MNPSWTGWSLPFCSSPSTVMTVRPSAWTAKTVHDFTGRPSRRTVQAPQWVVSHPMCVPVRRNTSRIRWTRSSRGSTSASRRSPLIVTPTRIQASFYYLSADCWPATGRRSAGRFGPDRVDAAVMSPRGARSAPRPRALECAAEGPGRQDPHQVALVLDRPAQIRRGIALLGRDPRHLADRRVVHAVAAEQRLGAARLDRRRPHVGQADPYVRARVAAGQRELDPDAGGREVADLPFQLKVRPTRVCGRQRDADLRE